MAGLTRYGGTEAWGEVTVVNMLLHTAIHALPTQLLCSPTHKDIELKAKLAEGPLPLLLAGAGRLATAGGGNSSKGWRGGRGWGGVVTHRSAVVVKCQV
jgi:hypothetical protein